MKPEQEKQEVVSESQLRKLLECPHAYYLSTHVGMTKVPRSTFAAQTLFFDIERRKLFNVHDRDVGRIFPEQRRAGPELKLAEEMSAQELQRYLAFSSPEAFGGHLLMSWLRVCKKGSYAGSELVWSYEGQAHKGAQELRAAGENYYKFILEHGAPVEGTLEKQILFDFEGVRLQVRLPELRPGSIDDPTLWGFNADVDEERRSSIKTSSLVTLRLLAYSALSTRSELFRLKLRIPEEVAESLAEHSLDSRVKYRHLNGQTGEVLETARSPGDLDRFRRGLERFFVARSKEEFPPEHEACGSCPYNTIGMNGKALCSERDQTTKPLVPGYYFRKKDRAVIVQTKGDLLVLDAYARRVNPLTKQAIAEKHVATYTINVTDTLEGVVATGTYDSPVRGHGFELSVLKDAFKALQGRANELGEPVTHRIDFSAEFDAAGKMAVAALLEKKGYEMSVEQQGLPSRRHYEGAMFTKQYMPVRKKRVKVTG